MVSHGLERGELGQVVGDLGVEDLVADGRADQEAHHHADADHDAHGRAARPIADLSLPELILRVDEHVPGKRRPQRGHERPQVSARRGLDEDHFDEVERPGRDAQERVLTHHEVAIRVQVRAHAECPAHVQASTLHLGRPGSEGPEVAARAAVDESAVGPGEPPHRVPQVLRHPHRGRRIHTEHADRALEAAGLLPEAHVPGQGPGRRHAGRGEGLIEALPRDAPVVLTGVLHQQHVSRVERQQSHLLEGVRHG